MKNDEIAIHLNEHPEFFNEYPELLQKIKAISMQDLPLEPLPTLSVAGRIIQRAHADKEHLKGRLEWFLEIAQANQEMQDHIQEIERMVISSTDLPRMVSQFCEEITERFNIKYVQACLVDGADHFIENKLSARFSGDLKRHLFFADQETVSGWFGEDNSTRLHSEVEGRSEFFQASDFIPQVQSEALVPIVVRGAVAGAIGFGSIDPYHFHQGLRTDFLDRLADKFALAIDNLLLLDLLKRKPALDKKTGFYNRDFLDPLLLREFDRAQRYNKALSCIKMRIDYFDDLLDTYGKSQSDRILREAGKIIHGDCREKDIVIRSAREEFLLLLPEIDSPAARKIAQRLHGSVGKGSFANGSGAIDVTVSLGVATWPDATITTRQELVEAASHRLNRAVEEGRNRVIVV